MFAKWMQLLSQSSWQRSSVDLAGSTTNSRGGGTVPFSGRSPRVVTKSFGIGMAGLYASCPGVNPLLSAIEGFAPACKRSLATSQFRREQATCKGVCPIKRLVLSAQKYDRHIACGRVSLQLSTNFIAIEQRHDGPEQNQIGRIMHGRFQRGRTVRSETQAIAIWLVSHQQLAQPEHFPPRL